MHCGDCVETGISAANRIPVLRDFLPLDFIGAGPDYLTAQSMGRGIEVPVEIFIDRHLFDISAHRCTIAASHSQVSLRRHISCEVYTPIASNRARPLFTVKGGNSFPE